MARPRRIAKRMLIWVCALHCEAKPVIDFYHLKKSHQAHAFDIYLGDDMLCIVSGPGKLASAAATAWVAAKYETQVSLAWINLGIAGTAKHAIGSIFLINQIIDADNDQHYYPVQVDRSDLPAGSCISYSQACYDYPDEQLVDMEASGFFHSALRFSTAELIQCIKIISDNQSETTGRNRQKMSDLIQYHIVLIDRQATNLLQISAELDSQQVPAEAWQQFSAMARFSQTQKSRLRILLGYLLGRGHSAESLIKAIGSPTSSRKIIKTLEQLGHRDSLAL